MKYINVFSKQRFSFYQVVGNAYSFVKLGLNKVVLLLAMVLSAYSKSTMNWEGDLNHQALKKALQYSASTKHNKSISNDKYIVIIDYTMPSNKERLFLYNTKTKKVEHKFLVAHGKGSGRGAYAEKFSNTAGTQTSSKGVFVTTGSNYHSKFNRVIHVEGLEKGINDNAAKRAIEFHDAWYVSKDFADKYQRVGNSFGCFAMNLKDLELITPLVDNGTLVYVYG